MEYIEGRDIDDYFQFEEGEHINSVFVQIVNAFAYLEKNKILHRDVRAGNVLINLIFSPLSISLIFLAILFPFL